LLHKHGRYSHEAINKCLGPAGGADEVMKKGRILIADDQDDIILALELLLKNEGYELCSAQSPAAVLEALKLSSFDLLLMDLNYARDPSSVREGMELLTEIERVDPLLPIVVMTGWGSIDLAVEAMRLGAVNFIQKPWENRRLLQVVREQFEQGKTRRQAEHQRTVEKIEFDEAEAIQRAFLPPSLPKMPGCGMAVRWQPKERVGGDYYDVFPLASRRLAFCVADASGKGLPAALLMSNFQAGLRSYATASASPAEVVSRLNQLLCANHLTNKFITLFYGVLDLAELELTYTNAGHPSLVICRRDGSRTALKETGGIVGVFSDWTYRQEVQPLQPGDRLWLFTDGISEAHDGAGNEFGPEHLNRILAEAKDLSLAEAQEFVWRAVLDFCSHTLEDDATLLAFEIV
jgi:phosphoserine phosphatase RsbU/P